MFTVELNGKNRLDIELNGKLDTDTMRTSLDDLINKSQSIENGRMLYKIGDFNLPSIGAIGVELSRLPQLFKLIGKFDKAAVTANQRWIRGGSEIKGALIPGLEIKAFEIGEEAEAEAWLKLA